MRNLRQRLAQTVTARRGKKPQLKFSKEIGLSNATLNRIENARQNVTLEILEVLCEAFDCDVGELFDGEG